MPATQQHYRRRMPGSTSFPGGAAYNKAERDDRAKRLKLTQPKYSEVKNTLSDTDRMLALARKSLLAYGIAKNPGFKAPRHVRIIAQALGAVSQGKIRRLIIEMPPRHGKSYLISETFPEWYFGHHPDHQMIFTTYGQTFADRFGRKVGDGMGSALHKAVFPECSLRERGLTQSSFETQQGGEYVAVGAGGSLTGRGANVLIIDDATKNYEEAASEAYREKLWEWYESTARTRLMPGGAVISVQTRWFIDDLSGRLRVNHANEGWHIITMPAMDENDNPLWPEQFDKAEMQRTRANVDPKVWWSLYMQQPTVADGQIFRRDKFWFYENPPPFSYIMQSWDTAFKTGTLNDYSVCQTWGIAADGYYLIDQWRGRVEYSDLFDKARELADQHGCQFLLVEDAASGQSLIQELRLKTRLAVTGLKPWRDQSKAKAKDFNAILARDEVHGAEALSLLISTGKIRFPKNAPFMRELLDEFCAYDGGNSGHDDQVKAAIVFSSHITNNGVPDYDSYRGTTHVMRSGY